VKRLLRLEEGGRMKTSAQFDNVLVRNLGVPLASAAPGGGDEARVPAVPGVPPGLYRSLMAMLAADHREPQRRPNHQPEPLKLAMIVLKFDALGADGRLS
jgi:hypothetical protein